MGKARNRYDLVIAANRLPVHQVEAGKSRRWKTSPGGLVSALVPVMEDRASVWVGWPGANAGRPRAFNHEGFRVQPLHVEPDEIEGFYEGFSNSTLWPLYHDVARAPTYHRAWWQPYVDVNQRFADAIAEVAAKGAVAWIHDYHLHLVPAMLRKLRPDLRIGFFLHIPFPPPELFSQLPWRKEVLEGTLGADVVGFQTASGARNFAQLADRYTDARRNGTSLSIDGRTVKTDAFPVSIDVGNFEELVHAPRVIARAQQIRDRIGSRRLLLGVDRLDYTKGIDQRLRAVSTLLESGRLGAKDIVVLQTAVPSRERVDEYQALRASIARIVGELNGDFGDVGRTPIQYLHRNLPREELVALYLAADVMLVTPLRDGMNLVAKEYVACRTDNTGVLVLSEFTGSAAELKQALLVNPHDIDGMAGAILQALNMDSAEQARRMRSLRRTVSRNDVHNWAGSFFEALES